ncbi:hypothetical protein Cpir12675_002140 [Ceratocystis pirilliformis]|uniref:Polysaccharide biosynthesis domain-containing protein n=1 Tax=Ceratocystis pirilliformis TaxID=259994 RepID=A0ABR3ZBK3_9PEZI
MAELPLTSTAKTPKNFNPEQADNLEDIEKQFAVKAVQHMEVYMRILQTVPGSTVRLTKIDDEIMEHLAKDFPEFDPAKPIDENEMKSSRGKECWRNFMMAYEKRVDDYNFGTVMRIAPNTDYGQHTTIFVPRMQFYAIEIARNRAGLNDWIHESAKRSGTA